MLTFEKIIEPVILLIKEEQNRLKNDEKLYNLAFAHFFIIITDLFYGPIFSILNTIFNSDKR
jgi:hypothetical protein